MKSYLKEKLTETLHFKNSILLFTGVIIFYLIMTILNGSGSLSSLANGLLVPICIYSILAVSLNLTVGILGELSLGHAGFMCIGAFTGAFTSIALVNVVESGLLRFLISLFVAIVCSAIIGIVIAIPVLRLKGDYLAIVTLGFGEIIKNIINILYGGTDSTGLHFATSEQNLKLGEGGTQIIKGALGITGTKNSFASTFTIGIILLLITLFVVLNLIKSRTGRAIMAIRDNRIAAESVGINISKYKVMAFTISAAFAGMAGVLYAHNLATLTASPKNFGYNMSIMILVFVVLGGIGNISGSVIAAMILTILPEYLRGLQEYRMFIYSIVLIVLMLFNWSPKAKTWKEQHTFKILLQKIKRKKPIKGVK